MNYNQLTNEEQILGWFSRQQEAINSKDGLNQHILDWVFNGYRGKDCNKLNICRLLIDKSELSLLSDETIEKIFLTTMLDKTENLEKNKTILNKLECHEVLKQDHIESNVIINSINQAKTYHELSETEKKLIINNSNVNIEINNCNEKNLLHPVIYCSLSISKSFNIFKNLNYIYDYQEKNELNFQKIPFQSKYLQYIKEDIKNMLDIEKTKNLNDFFEQIIDIKDGCQETLNEIVKKSKKFQLEKLLKTKEHVSKHKI